MHEPPTLNHLFWKAWRRNPREVGAVLPSGPALAGALAAQVEPDTGTLVELGARTGVVTKALLVRGVAPQRLILIEKSPPMAAALVQQFPDIPVLQGDAARLSRLLDINGMDRPSTVLSSLPLISLPWRQRMRILCEIAACLPANGRLVQFTYSSQPPITPSLAESLGLAGRRTRRVAMNLPPAAVWVYVKRLPGNSSREETTSRKVLSAKSQTP